jgi:hypothetical protein
MTNEVVHLQPVCAACRETAVLKETDVNGLSPEEAFDFLTREGPQWGWHVIQESPKTRVTLCRACFTKRSEQLEETGQRGDPFPKDPRCPKCLSIDLKRRWCAGNMTAACGAALFIDHLHWLCERCNHTFVTRCADAT